MSQLGLEPRRVQQEEEGKWVMFGEATCQVKLASVEAATSTATGLATSRPLLQTWHSYCLRLYVALKSEIRGRSGIYPLKL